MKIVIFFLIFLNLFTYSFSQENIDFLYLQISPFSLEKQCAFYNLYPNYQKSFNTISFLLNSKDPVLINCISKMMVSLKEFAFMEFSNKEIFAVDQFFSFLNNRNLKGNKISSFKDILDLKDNEIDLSLSLILSEKKELFRNDLVIKRYEIFLDLLTAQVIAYLKAIPSYTKENVVECINRVLFQDQNFKYPPKKDMYSDKYTFLSSVIDGKFGVCLGTSVLFLSISQRLNLPLEIITPPGHIYLRLRKDNGDTLNIETTAFGKHIDTENYIDLDKSDLKERSLKEVIGLTFMNRGTFFLHKGEYTKALDSYKEAFVYFQEPLLKELLGFSLLFCQKEEEGLLLLNELKEERKASSLSLDYLQNNVSLEGIKSIFFSPGNSKKEIEEYAFKLKEIQSSNPFFKEGYNRLASCFINLGYYKEALKELEKLYLIDKDNICLLRHLSELSLMQMDHRKAEKYYNEAKEIIKNEKKDISCLKSLKLLLQKSIYALKD